MRALIIIYWDMIRCLEDGKYFNKSSEEVGQRSFEMLEEDISENGISHVEEELKVHQDI